METNLADDDVVNVIGSMPFDAGNISKMIQLRRSMKKHFGDSVNYWFRENGVECEVLRANGGGWQKGRLRFRLEFVPDEPQKPKSPLDDLRSSLDSELS